MNTPTNRAAFPVELRCLFQASRYKVLHGGRGSAKSWSVARALLMRGIQKRLRILCTREFQNSLADSVHRLLADQVELLQLSAFYTVGKSAIIGANGTEFRFAGIRHNISKIKSFEGFDIVWIEEGQTVSKNSKLRRRDGGIDDPHGAKHRPSPFSQCVARQGPAGGVGGRALCRAR